MTRLTKTTYRFGRETHGQDLIEYSLLLGIITLSVTLSLQALPGIIIEMYTNLQAILEGTI